MFNIQIEMKGDIDIDSFEVEIECPICEFTNPIWIKQARLRDVIICRGCKANMRLDDSMNGVRKARQNIQRQLKALQDQLARMFR
jgi:hypothetical protein